MERCNWKVFEEAHEHSKAKFTLQANVTRTIFCHMESRPDFFMTV